MYQRYVARTYAHTPHARFAQRNMKKESLKIFLNKISQNNSTIFNFLIIFGVTEKTGYIIPIGRG